MAKLEMLDFHFEFFYNISTGSVRNSMKALNSSAIHWSVEFNLKVLKFGWDEMDFFLWVPSIFNAINWQWNEGMRILTQLIGKFQSDFGEVTFWMWWNGFTWWIWRNSSAVDWKFIGNFDVLNWIYWIDFDQWSNCFDTVQQFYRSKTKKWINRLVITTFVNFNTENVVLSNKTWNSHHRTLTISNTLR